MIKLRKVDYVSQAAELSAYLCNEVSRVALIEIGGQEMTASANHTASTIFLRGKLTVGHYSQEIRLCKSADTR